jgi:CRP-like cAMP-binding protein
LACEYIEFSNGTKAEIGMIGREGLPGFQTLLRNATATSSCRMQTAGAGIQVPLDQLKALFAESTEFRDQIHRLAQNQLAITAQVAACNAHHQTEARLARWILMAWERLGQSRLNATQAQLAEMLGVRRSTIALIAATLQRGGSIAYTRGNIAVKNRAVLEEIACECYGICRDAMEALYKNEPAPGSNSATDRQPLGLSPVIAS